MKVNKLALISLMVCSTQVNADMLYGIYVEAGVSRSTLSGDVFYGSSDNNFTIVDEDSQNPFASIKIEHPIPLIPNIRVAMEKYDFNATGLSNGFEFDGEGYNIAFDTGFSGSETTGTLYYEILDNVVSLDLGVSVKNINADVSFDSDMNSPTSENINIWIPTVYASAEAYIPFAGVIVGGQLESIAYDGNEFTIADVYVGYEVLDLIAADITVKLGYKIRNIKLNDVESFTMDLSNESAYASIQVHF